MCGICFVAAREKTAPPKWLPPASPAALFPGANAWSATLSAPEIARVVCDELHDSCQLTASDHRKLHNLEALRALQDRLVRLRNSKQREQAASVEAHIADLSRASEIPHSLTAHTEHAMARILARGPDHARAVGFAMGASHILAFSSVLSLRQPFTPQPVCSSQMVVQFNGELYNADCGGGSDTAYVAEKLRGALAAGSRRAAVLSALSSLSGEFAIVVADVAEHTVYFAKDAVGKRSLLYRLDAGSLIVSSVALAPDSVECKGNTAYIVDLQSYAMDVVALQSCAADSVESPSHADSRPASCSLERRVAVLGSVLQKSCLARQTTIQPLHRARDDVELGILFSGGLDCSVLAAVLANNYVQMEKSAVIDLLTVGFENPRTGLAAGASPDRQLSEQSWVELCSVFSGTCVKFRLVQIDVSYKQWLAHRQRVLDLIAPCSTEMDLSIAIAFYFACRAQDCEAVEFPGTSACSWAEFQAQKESLVQKTPGYTSPAKVLFSGLGADELFGGYSRHENIFNGLTEASSEAQVAAAYAELRASLAHDISVIYERNLGRDDRATSSWGKELRYPYLDQEFIRAASETEPHHKVKFWWATQKTKKGEKRAMRVDRKHVLRQLAVSLGLEMASKEAKRAIQFGAKSAKMEIGQNKARGTDKA